MKKITLSNGSIIYIKNVDKIKTAKVHPSTKNQNEFYVLANFIGEESGTFIGPFQTAQQAENCIINDLA